MRDGYRGAAVPLHVQWRAVVIGSRRRVPAAINSAFTAASQDTPSSALCPQNSAV